MSISKHEKGDQSVACFPKLAKLVYRRYFVAENIAKLSFVQLFKRSG